MSQADEIRAWVFHAILDPAFQRGEPEVTVRSTIHLVSCVRTKRNATVMARDLYASAWFRKARAYGEERGASGSGPRVVRVGTHALRAGSRSTLWNRLSRHRGSARKGDDNHRGSIFRLLVGEALVHRDNLDGPETWGCKGDADADGSVGAPPGDLASAASPRADAGSLSLSQPKQRHDTGGKGC